MCKKNLEYFCAIFGAMEFEKWNLYKISKKNLIKNLELSFNL